MGLVVILIFQISPYVKYLTDGTPFVRPGEHPIIQAFEYILFAIFLIFYFPIHVVIVYYSYISSISIVHHIQFYL